MMPVKDILNFNKMNHTILEVLTIYYGLNSLKQRKKPKRGMK